MKRLTATLLCLLLTLALTACNVPAVEPTPDDRTFLAAVIDTQPSAASPAWAEVEPLEGEAERRSADRIEVSLTAFDAPFLRYGDIVRITYDGLIEETYPAQIHADSLEKVTEQRDLTHPLPWAPQDASDEVGTYTEDVTVTAAYADCFFAQLIIPHAYVIKINAPLPDGYCVGDQVNIVLNNARELRNGHRIEGDLVSIRESEWTPDPFVNRKPVIYLYPEREQEVFVALDLQGELTCTYPAYRDGWTVTASPDGTLTDDAGQTYNYLYWEGVTYARWDLSEGFCVKGDDTAAFLETALASLGLTRKEANEFIVYWLPLMEQNPYNLISFQKEAYTDTATLTVTPTPDTVIRVFMVFKPLDTAVDVPPQTLSAPARRGFTVVEWGGTKGQ